MDEIVSNTQMSYDQVAAEYAEKFKDEMDDKPFDRDCLNRLAREVGGLSPICDMGCGPGQIAFGRNPGTRTKPGSRGCNEAGISVCQETMLIFIFALSVRYTGKEICTIPERVF